MKVLVTLLTVCVLGLVATVWELESRPPQVIRAHVPSPIELRPEYCEVEERT